MEEKRNAYRLLVGKPEGKRPLGKPSSRWVDKLRWVLEKLEGGIEWIHLAQDRKNWRGFVNVVMSFRVP
jgi:hypothetical protein